MDMDAFLKNILQLKNEHLISEIQKIAWFQNVSKKEKLLREGEIPQYIILSVEGIFRSYIVNEQGREITDCIVSRAGASLMTDFNITNISTATQESLTPGKIFKIPLKIFLDYAQNYPEIAQYYNKEFLECGQYHMEKSRILSYCNAEKRYLWFLKTHPGVVNQIPDKYIASYLQISTVTMSQVKKKLRESGYI